MTAVTNWLKQKPPKIGIDRIYNMVQFDIPDVKWIERYLVGSTNPLEPLNEAEIAQQLQRVNDQLRYGKIISVETNLTALQLAGRDVVTQYTVYHIGYKSRPNGK